MLTACGIETLKHVSSETFYCQKVATVLTACGIETLRNTRVKCVHVRVATVLTACGIETEEWKTIATTEPFVLQQCLPLAVLKRTLYIIFRLPELLAGCNSAYRLRY